MVASSGAVGTHIAFEEGRGVGGVLCAPEQREAEPGEAQRDEADVRREDETHEGDAYDSGAGAVEERVQRGWVAGLLEGAGGVRACSRRVAIGVALSATYGLAMGMRSGGSELLTSALGIALAPLAVLVLAVPALHIVLAVLDVPIEADELMRGAARGTAATGLALAGLAPAAALFVVTTEAAEVAGGLAGLGLLVAGLFGLLHLRKTYAAALRDIPPSKWFTGNTAFVVFSLFSMVLALRIWWPTLSRLLSSVGGAA